MRKILVVEDQRDIRILFRWYLERQGYLVEAAEDGVAGLEAIRRFQPDLVLLNILMPRMDGLTMLKMLGEECPSVIPRVVMITASSGSSTFESAVSLGAIDYLVYPLDMQLLTQVVREALDPKIDASRRLFNARFRRALVELRHKGGEGFEAIRKLAIGELSRDQRRELRDGLLDVVARRLKESGIQEGTLARYASLHPGVDFALTAMALARAL